MSPLEIRDAHLTLADVGANANHLDGGGDAVETLATLVAWDEVLDVVESVELVAHLLLDLGAVPAFKELKSVRAGPGDS